MIYTLFNIQEHQSKLSIVSRRKVTGGNRKPYYYLIEPLTFQLSDYSIIYIHEGFTWDLSSVPRPLWGLLPPDGDFEVASLIHDFLYIYNKTLPYHRSFADKEMLLWSKVVSGTNNKISLRNFDNQIRYMGVVIGGWYKWYKIDKKIKNFFKRK